MLGMTVPRSGIARRADTRGAATGVHVENACWFNGLKIVT